MTIKINGDNSVANPGFTGADTDTGLQVGTNELKLVTGGTARATVDSAGKATFTGDVQAGGSPAGSTPSAVGTLLDPAGALIVSRASGDVFLGKKQNTGVTSTIDVDGNAAFDGEIKVEGANTPSGRSSRISKYGSLLIGSTSDAIGSARGAVDSGNGNAYFLGTLGVGTTSPSQAHPNMDDLQIGDATGNRGITVSSSSSGFGTLAFGDSTDGSGTDRYQGFIEYYHNDNSLRLGTVAQEKLRIDSSGRLLVGSSSTVDSSSTALLQTSASGGARLALGNPNTVGAGSAMMGQVGFYGYQGAYALSASISAHASATWSTNDYPTRLSFSTTADGASSPIERMRIDPTGMVRTRGTDASGALNVFSSIGGSTSANLILGQHSASDITSGTLSFLVYTNGNVVNSNNSYGSLSDVNLKENIVDANSQWADIKGVRVRNYNFKEETGNETFKQLGVVAQEVEEVSPGLVTTNKDGIKSVNYSVLYMKAVKALQEAMTRIETLETKVAALEAA